VLIVDGDGSLAYRTKGDRYGRYHYLLSRCCYYESKIIRRSRKTCPSVAVLEKDATPNNGRPDTTKNWGEEYPARIVKTQKKHTKPKIFAQTMAAAVKPPTKAFQLSDSVFGINNFSDSPLPTLPASSSRDQQSSFNVCNNHPEGGRR
jgi:hypothetical protein